MGKRPLTLSAVPPEFIAEFALQHLAQPSFRCDDPDIVLMPIGRVLAPERRMLNIDAVRSLLSGISSGASIPAVVVVREVDDQVTLLDGMHRYMVSSDLGFRFIPCLIISEEDAAVRYSYWRRLPSLKASKADGN
jgi:hypothetical protein